jgi:phage gp45-like
MQLYETLRLWRAGVMEFARQLVANAIVYAPYSLSTASGEQDKVEGYKTEGEGEEAYDLDARRVGRFGLRSRPPKGIWAVWLAVGGGPTNGVVVAEDSTRYGPSDLEDGEVALYNIVAGVEIRLDKDGNINIRSADGKRVKFQGGDRGIARKDDSVDCGTLLFTPNAGTTAASLAFVAPGKPVPPIVSPTVAIPLSGTISSASDKATTG